MRTFASGRSNELSATCGHGTEVGLHHITNTGVPLHSGMSGTELINVTGLELMQSQKVTVIITNRYRISTNFI